MTPEEIAFRKRIVEAALRWKGTPYILGACVKGVGVDCARFLLGTFQECGLMREEEIGVFSQDWFAHTTEEKYLFRILRHAAEVARGLGNRSFRTDPGNIVLSRAAGQLFTHAGIVLRWPFVIHAAEPEVSIADASRHPLWMMQQIAAFDPWQKQAAHSHVR